jgi:hypothetical protein
MDDLLTLVVAAHGGLDRWSRVSRINAHMTIGGPFWEFKGQPGIIAEETVELDTQREHIRVTPFAGAGRSLQFGVGPEYVVVTAPDGTVVAERTDPRTSFAGYDRSSRWDMLQTGYFIGYAIWNYLAEPFLLSYPGVEAHEIEPWAENGETWRRLRATFPPSIATHSTVGLFYFDADGMQRRMDYEPAVNGNLPAAHYTDEPKTFDGIVVPTRRRVRRRLADGTADMTVDYITIDIHDVEYHA